MGALEEDSSWTASPSNPISLAQMLVVEKNGLSKRPSMMRASLLGSHARNARSSQMAYLLKLPPWPLPAQPRDWLAETGELSWPVAKRKPRAKWSSRSSSAPSRKRRRARWRS